MAFNIKSEDTHRLAREIADLTDVSMAQAVDTALRERRERLARKGLAERLATIRMRAAKYVPEGASSADDKLLYDDAGLPK
ncbi:MAG: type II toxin-antitoxin system VapB family antitoxin [Solirubrobacterales bacterium]